MSLVLSSSVSRGTLVADDGVGFVVEVVVRVLGRRGCEIRETREFDGAALMVGMVGATLVVLVAVGPVFRAAYLMRELIPTYFLQRKFDSLTPFGQLVEASRVLFARGQLLLDSVMALLNEVID